MSQAEEKSGRSSFTSAVSSVLQRLRKLSEKKPVFTLSQISEHCHRNDCWIVINDNVYDVTAFLDTHPGGLDVLLEHAGRDATVAFYGAGHLSSILDSIRHSLVGTLAPHERINLIDTVSCNHNNLWTADHMNITVSD